MESLRGKLLIAGAGLWDPNFRRTVVLIGHHDEDGAVGVVLNRATDTPVAEAVPPLAGLVDPRERLFFGGPVRPREAVVVAEVAERDEIDVVAFDSIGFLTDEAGPERLGNIRQARVFAGCAGWEAGQLDAEIEEGSWIPEPARAEDVFTREPERLWEEVLRRKGREFDLLRLMPIDPSLN
ncbi:MAG: YqgE/AlgH family protein [Actinomycetota bacterium]